MEVNEIATKRFAPLRVEVCRERSRWPITFREGVPRCFAAWFGVVGDAFLEAKVEGASQQLSYAVNATPLEGRWRSWIRRGRHVWLHHLEHFEEIAVCEPGGDSDSPASAADASEFFGRGLGAAGEHDPTGGYHGIELSGFKRKAFSVADLVGDGEIFSSSYGLGHVEEVGCNIGPNDAGAAAGDD